MKRSTFRELVRSHYRSASLPSDTVSAWLAAHAPGADSGEQSQRRWTRGRRILVAACAAMIVALLWTDWRARPARGPSLVRAIATEVAANHAKSRPLDVEASSFSELRRAMDRFDFTLVQPESPHCADLTLVGARYCSIQGRPAAQIRLSDERGETFTLYETRDDASFVELREAELVVDGSIVRIWRGDGLLFALATAAH